MKSTAPNVRNLVYADLGGEFVARWITLVLCDGSSSEVEGEGDAGRTLPADGDGTAMNNRTPEPRQANERGGVGKDTASHHYWRRGSHLVSLPDVHGFNYLRDILPKHPAMSRHSSGAGRDDLPPRPSWPGARDNPLAARKR
ncbi:hypothetical protein E2C01_082982 [Portunus trituberculatus]|uniref:Uncharacterized protein n=1 Tax=Portunus trituberculatus TaxID=210409 RepID=A0A5B7IVZ7_PORTR|nr:hypothetical protein [Portunus trituberculatus]